VPIKHIFFAGKTQYSYCPLLSSTEAQEKSKEVQNIAARGIEVMASFFIICSHKAK